MKKKPQKLSPAVEEFLGFRAFWGHEQRKGAGGSMAAGELIWSVFLCPKKRTDTFALTGEYEGYTVYINLCYIKGYCNEMDTNFH